MEIHFTLKTLLSICMPGALIGFVSAKAIKPGDTKMKFGFGIFFGIAAAFIAHDIQAGGLTFGVYLLVYELTPKTFKNPD